MLMIADRKKSSAGVLQWQKQEQNSRSVRLVPQLHDRHLSAESIRVSLGHGLQKESGRRCLLHSSVRRRFYSIYSPSFLRWTLFNVPICVYNLRANSTLFPSLRGLHGNSWSNGIFAFIQFSVVFVRYFDNYWIITKMSNGNRRTNSMKVKIPFE